MIDNRLITPKFFIKTSLSKQRYECGICYEICFKPVKCRGSCGRIFCMRCVSDTRQALDKCPNRCSSPFLVVPISDIEVEFYCPYSSQLCKALLKSLKDFNQHYQTCQFVSSEQVRLKKLQSDYKCLNSHQLQFFIGSYEQMTSSTCNICKQSVLCRSYCRICQQFYCVNCRIPPCSKEGCPIGHSYNFQQIANLNYICDICGISTAVSNDGVYDCKQCNFGICEGCYSELPLKLDITSEKSIIANINTQCSCNQTLVHVNSIHEPSLCELCKKWKQCPKYCQNCHKRYCLQCKLMDIYTDYTCNQQHQFMKYSVIGLEGFMQKQNEFGCMKCTKAYNQYYYDNKCFIRLCQPCFSYCMKVATDKQRPVLMKCDKNHVLMYISGPADYYQICVKCKQRKIIKLACNYCEQDQRAYCFQCKPIRLQSCYYQHKLRYAYFESQRECHYCMKNFKQFYFCKKCLFYVCRQCKQQSIQNKQLEQNTLEHFIKKQKA